MGNDKKTILLVEDEVLIAMAEARELEATGYNVVLAHSGDSAVNTIRARPDGIDLILMDIDLGKGMDGTQAAQEILKLNDIPVVFLSAHTESKVVGKTEKITSYGYVVKNSGITVLDASIKMAFKLHRAHRELREKETVLRESEALFHGLSDEAPVALVLVDQDEKYEYVNPMFTEIFGYTLDDIPDKATWFEKAYPDEEYREQIRGVWKNDAKRLREKGEVIGTNVRITCRDGSRKDVRVRSVAMKNGKFITYYEDITERVRAAEELRKSEAYYRLLFENSLYGVVVTGPDFRFQQVNDAFCSMIGYSRERLLGHMGVEDVTHPDDMPQSAELLRKNLSGQTSSFVTEKRYVTGSGAVLRAMTFATAIYDPEGRYVGGTAAIIDITGLRQSEARYRRLYDSIIDGFTGVDMDGRINECNAAFTAMLGYSRDELFSRSYRDITPRAWHEAEDRIMREQVLTRGYSEFYEKEYIRKDGTIFPVELRTYLLTGESGEPAGMWSIVRDITGRRRDEEEIVRLNRAYAVLTEVNSALVRGYSREELCRSICRIVVEKGGFDLAWIGRIDPATLAVVPVAWAGHPEEYVKNIRVSAGDVPEGRGPTGQSIREGKPAVFNDFFADHRTFPWKPVAEKTGATFRSVAGFPIFFNGSAWGALTLYDVKKNAFRDREVMLLLEVARTVSAGFGLYDDEVKRRVIEDALVKSEAFNRKMVESAPMGIIFVDKNGVINYENAQVRRIAGYPEDRQSPAMGLNIFDILPIAESGAIPYIQRVIHGETVLGLEFHYRSLVGKEVDLEVYAAPIFSKEGSFNGGILMVNDITGRKKTEEALRRLVDEKELLMKELQHRVKNNLAVISSLLNLEMRKLKDDAPRGVFLDAAARIMSLSAIYERLTLSEDLVSVDLDAYIRDLAESLFAAYNVHSGRIRLIMNLAPVRIDTRRAVPLGLILNELITNALKYAYPGDGTGEVRIWLDMADGAVTLRVSDDGAGLPAGFEPAASNTMGFGLIRMLTHQIGGTMTVGQEKGVSVSVSLVP